MNFIASFFAFLFVFFAPLISFAEEVGDVDMNVWLERVVELAKSGQWVAIAAGVVLVLVFIFRKYVIEKLNLGSAIVPWLSFALGIIASLAANVFGGMDPKEAANLILAGPLASSVWSLLLKSFFKKKEA